MKIAICDDEKLYCNKLHRMLDINSADYEIHPYTCSLTFVKEYSIGLYDIVFLDVDMPGLNGFETAQCIRDVDLDVDIVFVTYMENHIHMGYRYGAKEYLCKPINQQQVNDLMERLLQERRRRQEAGSYKVELKYGGSIFLPLSDVLYFESQQHYVCAITHQDRHIFRSQLRTVSDDLESKGFVRIHQSYLVNRQHVFKDFGDHVLLKTGEKLGLSRKYRSAVNKAFKGMWR